MAQAKISYSVISRRDVVVGLAAGTGLAACDGGNPFGKGSDTAGISPSFPDPISIITANDDFYITSCCGTPEISGSSWSCPIRDGSDTLATLELAWLESQESRYKEHTLECISANEYNPAISNAIWTGLPLNEIFEALGVTVPDDAVELVFTCEDGYTESLPIGDLDLPVWLVWGMNGETLPAKHGYPVRLLVPGRYGMKNPKWIIDMFFSTEPYSGFWEAYGWSKTAEYKANTLVRSPERRGTVESGELRIQGTAYAGSDRVMTVQVQVDDGEWQDATLDYNPSPDIWTLWHIDISLAPGEHSILTRCTTESGATTGDDPEGSDSLSGYDGGMEIEVEAL